MSTTANLPGARVEKEAYQRTMDAAVIQELEDIPGMWPWEDEAVEAASERVFRNGRSLLEAHRKRLLEIQGRRCDDAK